MKLPRVLVIGAGFAGIQVIKGLRSVPCELKLLDRRNHHVFQPLLYQVAAAALSPADIAYPIRRIFRNQRNVSVFLTQVDKIDLESRSVACGNERMSYDFLVLATGVTHSYLGHDTWSRHAPGLKSVEDALTIRRRILLAFEEAEHEPDATARRSKLTFVVVGGGPTGVELAGALREIAANDIPCDFRAIDTRTARIVLLQGGDRLLPALHPDLSRRALDDLRHMGVEVRLNARVTHVDSNGVNIGDERLDCQNVIWAAGVQAGSITRSLGVTLDKVGRVIVLPDLSVPGHPEVFVVGDAASAVCRTGPVPGLAPAAMQMGRHVARIIRTELRGRTKFPRPPFCYFDKGSIATIGKARAVGQIQGLQIDGFVAWAVWSLVHVAFLVSFRSRAFVLAGWVLDYLVGSRQVRLITGEIQPDRAADTASATSGATMTITSSLPRRP